MCLKQALREGLIFLNMIYIEANYLLLKTSRGLVLVWPTRIVVESVYWEYIPLT